MLFALLLVVTGATPVELKNAAIRLEFDPQQSALVSLHETASRRQYLAQGEPLYALEFTQPELKLASTDEGATRVRQDGAAVTVETDHQAAGVRVACRFELGPDSKLVGARISVDSRTPRRLSRIRFPILSIALPLGDKSSDDAVLLPDCDGCVVEDPLTNGVNRSMFYPGAASMQVLAAYDAAGGVYLACRDASGAKKRFSARRVERRLVLAVEHIQTEESTQRWAPPYDVALATLATVENKPVDWETAAELYRAWAVKQPWCRATLAQRVAGGDVPRWLVEPSLFYTYSIRGVDQNRQPINRVPLLLDQAERWRQVIGGPVTMMIMAWEKHDTWVAPDYFPPVGGETAFQAATRALHDKGHHTLVFLSGLKWTLHKELQAEGRPAVRVDDEAEFNRRGRASAVADREGAAVIYGKPDQGVGQNAQVCAATPLSREVLLGSAMHCARLGIDCVQADQIVGGGVPECYSTRHGHLPGGGVWASRALYEQFAAIRREGRSRSPEFAFSIEEPGEFFIPVLDVYHARDYQQGRWPRMGKGVRGVPLFTHVYHDYLLGYGGDSSHVAEHPSQLAVYHQAMNLVCGKTAGAAVWSRCFDPLKTHPIQARVLRSHLDLWRTRRDYLALGRRLPTPPLAVDSLRIKFPTETPKIPRELEVPAVLHTLWQRADGRVACVLASIDTRPQIVEIFDQKVTLEPGQAVLVEGKRNG
jgi:hypothetical protein